MGSVCVGLWAMSIQCGQCVCGQCLVNVGSVYMRKKGSEKEKASEKGGAGVTRA